jgi:hypothetical protein
MSPAWTVALSIVSSSAFAYLINVLFWNKQKGVEFKWDYRKYILDKRKVAYDEVQKVIHLCLMKKTVTGEHQYNSFFDNETALRDFIQYTEIVKSGWVSAEITTILTGLRNIAKGGLDHFLEYDWDDYDQYEHYEGKIEPENVLRGFGVEKLEQIERMNMLLQKAYISDIKNLGDIESFTKSINET